MHGDKEHGNEDPLSYDEVLIVKVSIFIVDWVLVLVFACGSQNESLLISQSDKPANVCQNLYSVYLLAASMHICW